jgi:Zn-finger nucleic acid-binding protein
MATVEIQGIEIERCPSCGGLCLDKGETEVVDALNLAPIIEGGVEVPAERRTEGARCYACERPMIALTGAGDVEYDWCDKCERVFFDRGELSALDAFADET